MGFPLSITGLLYRDLLSVPALLFKRQSLLLFVLFVKRTEIISGGSKTFQIISELSENTGLNPVPRSETVSNRGLSDR